MTHHAYYVEGPLSLLSEVAAKARAAFGFTANNNPSVFVEEWEKFGIDRYWSLDYNDRKTIDFHFIESNSRKDWYKKNYIPWDEEFWQDYGGESLLGAENNRIGDL